MTDSNPILRAIRDYRARVLGPDFAASLLAKTGLVGNLSKAMKKTVPLDVTASKPDPIWRNIKPVPNVESFKVTARVRDQLLLKFGLRRNIGGFIEYIVYRNRDINRYMEHQLLRMSRAKDDQTFWRIAEVLLLQSKVYYIIALNHVYPRWYKDMPWSKMITLYRQVRKCVLLDQMKYSRVYVEKANKKWRPLGVPSPSWRVWLCMINLLLVWRFDQKLSNNQHGFRPGRGTLSAWRHILTEVIPSNNIYEYDLKNFFDTVLVTWSTSTLFHWGLPREWVKMLKRICSSSIKLPSKENLKLDETPQLIRRSVPFSQRTIVDTLGFPQGASISPFLANVALEDTLFEMNPGQFIQYADDGLFYSNGKINLEPTMGMKTANIQFNPDKCGWVKQDGKWLKPLKFLGLVYDGNRDVFYSDTRSGKKLIFDKDGLIQALIDEDLGKGEIRRTVRTSGQITRKSWEVLAKSRFMGFVQSRLYNGSWNQETLWAQFLLQATSNSWVGRLKNSAIRMSGLVDIFNASSLASRSLLSLLRSADGSARKSWHLAKRLHVATVDTEGKPKVERHATIRPNPTPIKIHMASEWRNAYLKTFPEFERWVVHYISRITHRKDSRYSSEHLFFWYKAKYIHKNADRLAQELQVISARISFISGSRITRMEQARLDFLRKLAR